ncbi:hypothetical protein G6L28_13730 [Agrobacterium larrymoorei]|uniref:hypothetical protein n=1 Tax=Agrobacterium larrymoorei TaxID=160699 RepID=UPI001571AA6E|nr:hypothetical protein [Agrobacterium larrymoorei]NTJ43660.1 hypothetical protein [Agrobacterium larrymoorei]
MAELSKTNFTTSNTIDVASILDQRSGKNDANPQKGGQETGVMGRRAISPFSADVVVDGAKGEEKAPSGILLSLTAEPASDALIAKISAPDPSQRTTGEVEGRIIGYDDKFNPITEDQYKASIPPNKLQQQPVDNTEGFADVSDLINKFTSDARLSNEFYHYLVDKYEGAARPSEGTDVYVNPQNYTPEQKMARYTDLLKLQGQWAQYKQYRSTENSSEYLMIRNEREVDKDVDEAITTLLEDPEVAAALTSEYLRGFNEILSGKRFQEDGDKYDAAYDSSLSAMRSTLEGEFDAKIANGGIFADGQSRGLNENTILTKYNTALKAYAAVLSSDFIESRQDATQKAYDEFYSAKVSPLLPDTGDALKELTYLTNRSALSPEQLDTIGLVTPTVDGKTFVDLGLGLKAERFDEHLAMTDVDDKTRAEIKSLGLEGRIKSDTLDAVYLPTAVTIANQVIGTSPSKKAERAEFIEKLLTEMRGLSGKLEGGFDENSLSAAVDKIGSDLTAGKGPLAKYADEIVTALGGMVRGTVIADNLLLNGLGRAAVGGARFELQDMQAMIALGTGYAGKGMAENSPAVSTAGGTATDQAGIAKKVFGTESRMWDSSLLQRYGAEGLKKYSDKMVGDFQEKLPDNNVSGVVYDLFQLTSVVEEQLIKPLARSISEGLFAGNPEELARSETNVFNLMHNVWSSIKPGGSVERIFKQVQDLVSASGGAFNEGTVSIDAQRKAFSKWSAAFLVGTRTIAGGFLNADNLNPSTIAGITLHATQGAAYALDLTQMTIKDPVVDARTLFKIGEYADAAKKVGRDVAGTLGGSLSALVDIAWLPVDIYSFIRGLRSGSFDTTEKVLQGVMLASDVGVAVDATLSLARTLVPATTLQLSRFATLFTGTGGALMSALGGAFNLLNAGILIGMGIYQNIKEGERAERLTRSMDDNLWALTRNSVSQHLDYYPDPGFPEANWTTSSRFKKLLEERYYKEDITPMDWAAVREANRQRHTQAA